MRARRGTVRYAATADVDEIQRVLGDAFSSLLHHYTAPARPQVVPSVEVIRQRLDEGPVWVYDCCGVRGTVSAVLREDACYLRSMAVEPHYCGRGIGGALVETVARWARARGIPRVRLHTTPFLTAAIALYKKHGFRFAPEEDSTLEGTPLIAMERSRSLPDERAVE